MRKLLTTFSKVRRSLLLGLGLLPALVQAEGAVRVLDCRITQECDAEANCGTLDQTIEFRMEPIALDEQGAGRYTIRYLDQNADMQALSDAGPFHWRQESERHTLIASSETRFLWHSLSFDTMPEASIRFLSCRLRQQ